MLNFSQDSLLSNGFKGTRQKGVLQEVMLSLQDCLFASESALPFRSHRAPSVPHIPILFSLFLPSFTLLWVLITGSREVSLGLYRYLICLFVLPAPVSCPGGGSMAKNLRRKLGNWASYLDRWSIWCESGYCGREPLPLCRCLHIGSTGWHWSCPGGCKESADKVLWKETKRSPSRRPSFFKKSAIRHSYHNWNYRKGGND